MRRTIVVMIVVALAAVFLMYFSIFFSRENASAASLHALMSSSPVSSPTSIINQGGNAQSTGGIDPAIFAAILGFAGIIIGALIAGVFAIYTTQQSRKNEQQMREEQRKNEQQIREEQHKHNQEIEILRKELDAQYRAKELEKQREATSAEKLLEKMVLSQTNIERAKVYRQALHADPRVSSLQILDMSRPLELTNVYIRMRIHEDARLSYKLDPEAREAETKRDLDRLLQLHFKHLERRVNSSIDPSEAIRNYKRCVIVGDPGAGKTTLLKYLTLEASRNKLAGLPDLPILLELTTFASSGFQDLLDFAAKEWEDRYSFPKVHARSFIEENLKDGKAILLLDALDETVIGDNPEAAESSYNRVANTILQLATRYQQSPIVVTARKAGYQQRAPLVGFTELEVLDFRPEDIQKFVINWFNSYHDPSKQANAAKLNTKLQNNLRIQALAANPLLLSLIVLVYEDQLELPDRRAKLYERCVDTLLTRWDATRNIHRKREFKAEHKSQLLADIAWQFHLQGRRYFPETDLLVVIADFLPKIRLQAEQNGRVLAEITNVHGLLKEQARGLQGFLHLTLQEYFVAQYAFEHSQLDVLLAHRGDPWWEEVILLYAGRTSDASPFLSRLLGQNGEKLFREDLFLTNLVLAGRCLGAQPTIQQVALWDIVISCLFKTLMLSPYSLNQKHLAEALAAIGDEKVNKRLLQLLTNEQVNASVCEQIASALGSIGDRSITSALVQLLANEQIDRSVRGSIALALGNLGDRSVVTTLIELLSNEQIEGYVGGSIVEALGSLGDSSVVPMLQSLLSNKKFESYVRGHVALALGTLGVGNPFVVSLLIQQMISQEEAEPYVLQSTATALGKLGVGNPSVIAVLIQQLSPQEKTEPQVCQSVAEALGSIGDRSVVPTLMKLLSYTHSEPYMYVSVALALSRLGEHSVMLTLIPVLANEQVDPLMRGNLALTIGSLGDQSVVSALVEVLSNKHIHQYVRQNIAEAISKLANSEETMYALATLLQISDIADAVHHALWTISRRIGVRLFIPDDSKENKLEIIKW